MKDHLDKIKSIQSAFYTLIAALADAQITVIDGSEEWMSGTTTASCGILLEVDHSFQDLSFLVDTSPSDPDHHHNDSSIINSNSNSNNNLVNSSSSYNMQQNNNNNNNNCNNNSNNNSNHNINNNSMGRGEEKKVLSSTKWVFVSANIGDCKILHLSLREQLKIKDITGEMRFNSTDLTDPGGRLGSFKGTLSSPFLPLSSFHSILLFFSSNTNYKQ